MARIAGIDLPDNKTILYALPHISGIGHFSARRILDAVGIELNRKVKDLNEEEIASIRKEIDSNYKVEGGLRADISANIKRYIEIGSYRGLRHRAGLPVRGQRTRTNARTRKGPRRTSGTIKKKS
ncbi:30S ribosomal protein S13 [candidate division WOR-3 bacterium JGI_Cruoil_03_51_56]|uniref:Small ribosomal subunit protein uS13 n=1 Tax=candidate division WOR-3 bacterium JGI_Cruoil_03_51_56 TaxID=1973747 RepID=A0A235BQQ0_UNCW3|nr:MAG: 30S ribosomal protein S13 [candidate division WOR-3 bacterium JGI_Cruoil_03_51_56]